MSFYRLYRTPNYGEISPDVVIPAPEGFDLANPTVGRKKACYEILAGIVNEVSRTSCYDAIMTVPTEDIHISAKDGYQIPIRIYYPEGEETHRVMLFIHGGGFIANNLDVYEFVCRYICKYSKAVVFSVDYRLAPEYKCPVGREDCYTALEWLYENAARYNGDPNTISVCGDSAGGELTAAMALMARDRKGPHIEKQMMIFPLVTFTLPERPFSELKYGNGGYFLSLDSTKHGLDTVYFENVEDRTHPYNSPLLSDDLSNLPDAYFYSSECDPLLDQGLMYAAKLEDFGVKIEYNIYEGMIHGFLNRTLQKSYECLNQICADVNK